MAGSTLRLLIRTANPLKWGTYLGVALILGILLWQNHTDARQRTEILEALCGVQLTTEATCEPVSKLLNDNAMQTEILEVQNQELRDLQKLGICLMEAHGVPLPEGVQNEIDCHQLAESFAPSPPPQNQNPNTPPAPDGGQPTSPPDEANGGGGTPEEPDEPSFIEMLIAPITNLLR